MKPIAHLYYQTFDGSYDADYGCDPGQMHEYTNDACLAMELCQSDDYYGDCFIRYPSGAIEFSLNSKKGPRREIDIMVTKEYVEDDIVIDARLTKNVWKTQKMGKTAWKAQNLGEKNGKEYNRARYYKAIEW